MAQMCEKKHMMIKMLTKYAITSHNYYYMKVVTYRGR